MFLLNARNKKIITAVFITFGLLSFGVASADSCSDLAKQFNITLSTGSGSTNVNTIGGLPQICTAGALINSAINIIMSLAATIAVVFLMLGGFWYITAAGNDEQAEKGRKTLTSSIIGLVIIIMSFAIVRITTNFLMSNVSGDTASSSSSSSSSGTGSGSGSTGSGTGSGSGSGSNGSQTYVSTDSGNIFYNIPQSSVTDYKSGGQQDYLQGSVSTPTFKSNNQGLTVTSTVSAGDTSTTLVEMAAWCSGSSNATLNVYSGSSQIGSGTYQKSGGSWVATVDVSSQLTAGDTITYAVCGHTISGANATVPSGPR